MQECVLGINSLEKWYVMHKIFCFGAAILQILFVMVLYFFGTTSMVHSNPTFSRTYYGLNNTRRRIMISVGILLSIFFVGAIVVSTCAEFWSTVFVLFAGIFGVLTFVMLAWSTHEKYTSNGKIHMILTLLFLSFNILTVWRTQRVLSHLDQSSVLLVPIFFVIISGVSVVLLIGLENLLSKSRTWESKMSTSLTIHAYGFELIYSASLSIFFGSVGVMGNSLNQEGYENIIQKSFEEDVSQDNEFKPSGPMHFDAVHETAHSDTTPLDTAHFDTVRETAHSDTTPLDTAHFDTDSELRKFVAVGKH